MTDSPYQRKAVVRPDRTERSRCAKNRAPDLPLGCVSAGDRWVLTVIATPLRCSCCRCLRRLLCSRCHAGTSAMAASSPSTAPVDLDCCDHRQNPPSTTGRFRRPLTPLPADGAGPIAVGTAVANGPPHRSQRARQRTGLLPRVRASKRWLGQGCRIRGSGSHRASRPSMRFQVSRSFWLRRRSAWSQSRISRRRKPCRASLLSGTRATWRTRSRSLDRPSPALRPERVSPIVFPLRGTSQAG
jgi:hypothetical protein